MLTTLWGTDEYSRRLGEPSQAGRQGTTILEVLFATVIAVGGLLGVASLLLMGGRYASQANESTEAQGFSHQWYNVFQAREFNNPSRWSWFNDQTKTFGPYNASAMVSPAGSTTTATSSAFRHAICIDPSFYSDPLTLGEFTTSTFDSSQAYRPGLFPYYHDNYNPLSNPYSPATLPAPTSPGIVNQPRMLRMHLADPTTGSVLPRSLVEQIFMSVDDVATMLPEDMTPPQDKALPAQRLFEASGARRTSSGEYSWLATLCPRENNTLGPLTASERFYTLSIVVMHRRERGWFAATDSEPDSMPQGERLLAVTPQSGNFSGGFAGRVAVSSSTGVDSTIRSGDWMMFARTLAGDAVNHSNVFRWYRVVGVDADPVVDDVTGVWSQNVVLEGPDWTFAGPAYSTQATLLTNVVSVYERVISVP